MRHIKKLLLAAMATFALPWAGATENVTLQLKWHHQFQFAGYYAARELGYYRDEGLNVDILPVARDINPIDNVLDGHAQYGVGSNDLLLVRNAGHPVKVLAVIIQHSPYVLLSAERSGIRSIRDIVGKRVMLDPYATEISAFLKKSNIPASKIVVISKNDYLPNELISGEADAYAGYSTNDPYYFEKAGLKYTIFYPQSEGIDFYGDNLFTTESEIKNNPRRVKAFLSASLRGWNYALSHPEKTIDLMIDKGYAQEADREKLLFESRKLAELIHPDLVSVGYMNPERWQHVADTYADLGMLPKNFAVPELIYQEEHPLPTGVKIALSVLFLVSLTASAVAIKNHADRRMLFTRLFQSKNRFEKIVSSVAGAVFIYRLEPHGKSGFPYASKVFREMFFVDSADGPVTAEDCFRTVHQGDKETFFASLERSRRELLPWQTECRVNPPAGPMVWIHLNAIPEKDKNGTITWHGVMTDITEKKNAEIKLREMTAKREVAREEERKRIAREIHDELGQLMSVLRLNLNTLNFQYSAKNPDMHDKIARTVAIVDRAIQVVRELTTRLRPAVLDAGICSALEWMVKEFSESTGLECCLQMPDHEIKLSEDKAVVIFRIIQESLTNALKHAEASLIEITLTCMHTELHVTIQDDGKGFDLSADRRSNAYGILGMQERALTLGGDLNIESSPGEGTRLSLIMPVTQDCEA